MCRLSRKSSSGSFVAIGDAVLPGENSQKLVFANISDVHDYVAGHSHGALVCELPSSLRDRPGPPPMRKQPWSPRAR
eukprot:6738597-Prymnesium_polylepis.1